MITTQSQRLSGLEEAPQEGGGADQGQREKADERESKRIKAEDLVDEQMASDPNETIKREELSRSRDSIPNPHPHPLGLVHHPSQHHLQSVSATTSTILPDSIVEE
ncbi:hypothetical protein PtA15_8A473 [Puccinia triticina]|nr:uncharacterized protein PtA15_8A473 [Puccinia triticina]WAQ87569.1 hypothetical protein PtA15_8A473 [Puccinia triticina]